MKFSDFFVLFSLIILCGLFVAILVNGANKAGETIKQNNLDNYNECRDAGNNPEWCFKQFKPNFDDIDIPARIYEDQEKEEIISTSSVKITAKVE